jgi:nicotinate-nucleotide adenylyltransferase
LNDAAEFHRNVKTIAVFGGTFDPVHQGHLQSALELKQRLSLDQLRLLPCHIPPHRQQPGVSSQHRLAMVKLAIEGSDLQVDDCELQRDVPSYSIDTLQQLRQQLGQQVSLMWVMGADAFARFDSWHRWTEFLSLAHIVIMARPGEPLPTVGPLAGLLAEHRADSRELLQQHSAGLIRCETLTPYPISATAIRQALVNQQAVDELLPAAVLHYIQQHQLYAG